MLFKKRIVRVQNPSTTVVTPIQQPVVERNITIHRSGLTAETSVLLIIAGLAILALVWYLAMFRRTETQSITTTAPAVIEKRTTEVRTVPSPAVVIQQPASPAPQVRERVIVTPPVVTESVVVPPTANVGGGATRVDPPAEEIIDEDPG